MQRGRFYSVSLPPFLCSRNSARSLMYTKTISLRLFTEGRTQQCHPHLGKRHSRSLSRLGPCWRRTSRPCGARHAPRCRPAALSPRRRRSRARRGGRRWRCLRLRTRRCQSQPQERGRASGTMSWCARPCAVRGRRPGATTSLEMAGGARRSSPRRWRTLLRVAGALAPALPRGRTSRPTAAPTHILTSRRATSVRPPPTACRRAREAQWRPRRAARAVWSAAAVWGRRGRPVLRQGRTGSQRLRLSGCAHARCHRAPAHNHGPERFGKICIIPSDARRCRVRTEHGGPARAAQRDAQWLRVAWSCVNVQRMCCLSSYLQLTN